MCCAKYMHIMQSECAVRILKPAHVRSSLDCGCAKVLTDGHAVAGWHRVCAELTAGWQKACYMIIYGLYLATNLFEDVKHGLNAVITNIRARQLWWGPGVCGGGLSRWQFDKELARNVNHVFNQIRYSMQLHLCCGRRHLSWSWRDVE